MKIIDDGFYPWLVEAASFDSLLQIPRIKAQAKQIIPENLIPFSRISRSQTHNEFIHFYEHDMVFRRVLQKPEEYVQKFYPFPGIITPDCSLYRDMPLTLQLTNTYMSRAVGCYFQEQGIYVIPNIRWGDERSYKECVAGDIPFAFIGVGQNSVVAISTYGCIRGRENRYHFRAGLNAMMEYLKPQVVLVHGSMPEDVFCDALPRAEFHQYENWISQKRKKVS